MSEAANDTVIAVVVLELFQTLIRRGAGSAKDFLNRVFLAFLGGAGFQGTRGWMFLVQ